MFSIKEAGKHLLLILNLADTEHLGKENILVEKNFVLLQDVRVQQKYC